MKILVVEDNPKYLQDAKETLEGPINPRGLEVKYVDTLQEAKRELQEKEYHGGLLDVFFPRIAGEEPKLCGVELGEMALFKGIPILLITSTHHHGKETEEASRWARSKGMDLFDTPSGGLCRDEDGELVSVSWKFWSDAFFQIIKLMIGKQRGFYAVSETGIGDLFGDGSGEQWGIFWNYQKTLELYYRSGKCREWIKKQLEESTPNTKRGEFHREIVSKFVKCN